VSRPAVLPPSPTAAPVRPPRWLRAGAAVAATRLRPPLGTPSRRRVVCGAARLLTRLGARVEVRVPAVAWPRTGRGTGLLVVADCRSPLDALALLTALPGVVATTGVAGRVAGIPCPAVPPTVAAVAAALRRGTSVVVRPGEAALVAAAVAAGAPVCPVAFGHRGPAVPDSAGPESLRAALRWIGDARDVVVEVHLLPALSPAGAGAAELAGRALAAVREGGFAAGARREPASGGGPARSGYSVTVPPATDSRRVVSTAASIRRSCETRSSVPR
jgi:hypothetical protein